MTQPQLPQDADEGTVIYAVNLLRADIQALTEKVDDAVADRHLETKSIRDRLTRLEENSLTKAALLKWLGACVVSCLSGAAVAVAVYVATTGG